MELYDINKVLDYLKSKYDSGELESVVTEFFYGKNTVVLSMERYDTNLPKIIDFYKSGFGIKSYEILEGGWDEDTFGVLLKF